MSEKVLHIADQVGIFHANDGQTISRRMRIGSLEGARKIGCDYYVERHPTVFIRVGSLWQGIESCNRRLSGLSDRPTTNTHGD